MCVRHTDEPPQFNCPMCARMLSYVAVADAGILVYECQVHGRWELPPDRDFQPRPPELQ